MTAIAINPAIKLADSAHWFAVGAHAKDVRKFTNEPYVSHPWSVAQTLINYGAAEEVIAAGFLHDTIEDTGTTYEYLSLFFGHSVADMVQDVTKATCLEGLSRSARFNLELCRLNAVANPDSFAIKLADILDNVKTVSDHDQAFAAQYLAEKRITLELVYLSGKDRLGGKYHGLLDATGKAIEYAREKLSAEYLDIYSTVYSSLETTLVFP